MATATLAAMLPLAVSAEDGTDRFHYVRDAVFSDPYTELPQYRVDARLFGAAGDSPHNALRAAAARTLDSRDDLIEFSHGQKLFQPNGICFSGTWRINADTPFTGLFAAGTAVAAMVRASVMLDGTRRADRRAFALAVKLFPVDGTATENIVTMESMAGRRLDHVTDAVLDNEPALGGLPPLVHLGTLWRIRADLRAADRGAGGDGDYRYRGLYGPAAAGVSAGSVQPPRWIRLHVPTAVARVDADDFRTELDVNGYAGDGLYYTIELAAAHGGSKSRASWSTVGRLSLLRSVTSATCDHRLHFAHPLNAPQ